MADKMGLELQENSKMLKSNVGQNFDIEFQDLFYRVKVQRQKEKKTVLQGISGTFRAGELTAIMGPSGAGKSTLLNILTGFGVEGVEGSIKFGSNNSKMRKKSCYITQSDHFYNFFTVEESMMLAASLKISSKSMNIRDRKLLIESILASLKLRTVKSTRCGRLSGGQKKRLSIALELIHNPAVLFLDEPTTGLDSSTTMDTMQLLQNLANEGRSIICTIHQPSTHVYEMINQVYVLSQGYCIYQGSPHKTVNFLAAVGLHCPPYHNPADFLLECVNGDYGDYNDILREESTKPEWHYNNNNSIRPLEANNEVQVIKMSENSDASLTFTASKHIYPPPEWMRLWMLVGRCHVQILRDWTVTHLKLLLHIACALLVGSSYGDSGSNGSKQLSNYSLLMVVCLYVWFTTAMPAIVRIPAEIMIVKRETFNNWYKLRTFYLAHFITSAPVHIIFSAIYSIIIYLLTDQYMEIDRIVKFILTTMVISLCAEGMGVLVATILNPVNGVFSMSIITCFALIYSGFIIYFNHMTAPMRIISYLSPLRYGMENLTSTIFHNRPDVQCPSNVLYCHFKSAKTLVKFVNMERVNYGLNLLILLLNLVVYKSIAYIALKRKINQAN
ncbi:ATP-binding cassette sub-family G member 1 isoform X1 [Glossina fuscipes]|uniref:ATP-binding cassette sub-family G member 1 isoform X1 n=2 Tax=Glossina fuscipes TaxID=7396 RepID=A0A8U0W9Y7_9MUSC|nr:ATP-binding cassette sub-family G member 1 isoform X1 [Glossina fuscipes]XP_037881806.1 ATP-binding cassette sub-family G member 1 isoform X1 [Glossina fuscipes]XP_037881807.1 ATP-binding cassette sub-family G member 1 isoform X1 [Glossina fuscipes]